MKNSAYYDEIAAGYDAKVKESDEKGVFPWAGYSTAVETVCKAVDAFDKECDVLDLGCGTGAITAPLSKSGHKVVGVDFSPKMIEIAKGKAPEAEFILADLSSGFLPSELRGRKFRAIVLSYFFSCIDPMMRQALLVYLNHEVLADGGLILIVDTCFEDGKTAADCKAQSGDAWDKETDYPIYSEFRDSIPKIVFQKVSFCSGIMAFAKFTEEQARDNKPQETDPESEYKKEEYVDYTDEQVASWKRIRDIPGETVDIFGLNLMRALTPYELEATKNWKNYRERFANMFKGYFDSKDLLTFRTQAVTAYAKSSLALPENDRAIILTCKVYAAAFLHNRLPSAKIDMNLYAIYYGLWLNLSIVFKQLREDYGDSVQRVASDLENPKGTKVAEILLGMGRIYQ